jgi:hypothetical protein
VEVPFHFGPLRYQGAIFNGNLKYVPAAWLYTVRGTVTLLLGRSEGYSAKTLCMYNLKVPPSSFRIGVALPEPLAEATKGFAAGAVDEDAQQLPVKGTRGGRP